MTQVILWVGVDEKKARRRLVVQERIVIDAIIGDRQMGWTYRAIINHTQVIWKRDEQTQRW